MSIHTDYSNDTDLGWLQRNIGLAACFCLVLGGLLGIGISQISFQRGISDQLAEVQRELRATKHEIHHLTGFEANADKANSLLAKLEAQSGLVFKAARSLEEAQRLHAQVADLDLKLGSAQGSLDRTERLLGQLDRNSARVHQAQSMAIQLTDLVGDLSRQADKLPEAQATLASIDRLQESVINQQCMMPELKATVEAHRDLESSIGRLSQSYDATKRSLDLIARTQAKIQEIGIETEQAGSVLLQVDSLLAEQQGMQRRLGDIDAALQEAAHLQQDATRLQAKLVGNRKNSWEAMSNLDEMVWICEYLGSQGQTLAKAENSLTKIDILNEQAVRLDASIQDLVENVDLIRGLNATMISVVSSSVKIRTGLAEIMLMEPAVQKLAGSLRGITSPNTDRSLTEAKSRARQLMQESDPNGETVYVSQNP